MKKEKKLFEVQTPFPPTPTVTLTSGAWDKHIADGHPEMMGEQDNVRKTLASPTYVCEATAPQYVSFVSETTKDARGNPLMVCVNPTSEHGPIVATAYYSRKHGDRKKVKVVWP